MKIIKRILIFAFIIGIGVLAFLYWGTYESGVWGGKVLSISEKGVLFKTYEGKLSMESFGALRGTSPIAETRDFSVEKSNQKAIEDLKNAALSGDRVSLHYIKRFASFPWRGDTKYFVTEVERE